MRVTGKRVFALLCTALLLAALFGCGKTEDTKTTQSTGEGITLGEITTNPRVTIALEDGRRIVAELYPEKAPNTVSNFISLANSGYFAGKVFHRAMSGFMIQGGSPTGDGTSKGFPYSIKGEMKNNGFAQNDISHTQGVLSMARLNGLYDSASCQFFIMHGAAGYLDNEYAAFGKVIEGMDVVDAIATSPVTYSSPGAQQPDRLITPVVIKSVTAETFGVVYPEPATLPAVG